MCPILVPYAVGSIYIGQHNELPMQIQPPLQTCSVQKLSFYLGNPVLAKKTLPTIQIKMNVNRTQQKYLLHCVCHARNSDTTLDRTGTTRLFLGSV